MAEDKFLDDIGEAQAAPEPADKPEPKPEAEAPVKAEAEPAERTDPANSSARPEGYVPQQALAEARREAKEARDRAAIVEDRANKILERYFSENKAEPEKPDAPPHPGEEPNAEDDPAGWIIWRQRADRFVTHQQDTQRSQQVEQQRRAGEFQGAVKSDVQAFKAQTPDYDAARLFYWNQRGPELMALGYSQDEAVAAIEQDEMQIANIALQRRQSPAATLYNIAKARGYQAKAAAEPVAAEATADTGPEVKRDPATGQFLPAEQEKAARIKTSQERNGSIAGAPGAPIEKMTAKELASLSEEEIWRRFDSVKNSKGKKDFDRRMNFQ